MLGAEPQYAENQQVERTGQKVWRRGFTPAPRKKLRTGDWKGKFWISPDFDAPLSDQELKEWGA
ncbi:MAG: hypothetical protein Q8O42_22975 [Acidobacteriota bacterium]|nr:hypothetical protein [Acidobacteriota bacterium]